MKLSIAICACLLLLVAPLRADGPPKPQELSNPDFQLQIQAEHDTYFGGEPIVLTVTLTNKSGRKRNVGLFSPKAEWVVVGQNGKEASLTAYGTLKNGRRALKSQSMEAGQVVTYKVLINRLFDMSAADTYEITGRRWPISEDGKALDAANARVISNAIKIGVTEEEVKTRDENIATSAG